LRAGVGHATVVPGAAIRQPRGRPERLRDVAERVRVRQRPKLLQALILDLPDALARDVERAADLVERARMLAVEAVAQLEDAPLAVREGREDLAQHLAAHRQLRALVLQRQGV